VDFKHEILPVIKNIVSKSLHAVRHKLNPKQRSNVFELFGYDFILDEDFNPWLIEINTNPSLEESSKTLTKLFRRLIDDMYKLTIDQMFEKIKNHKKVEEDE
jgi:tubulin--tyrosine ligase